MICLGMRHLMKQFLSSHKCMGLTCYERVASQNHFIQYLCVRHVTLTNYCSGSKIKILKIEFGCLALVKRYFKHFLIYLFIINLFMSLDVLFLIIDYRKTNTKLDFFFFVQFFLKCR